jgi:hypothetical protein
MGATSVNTVGISIGNYVKNEFRQDCLTSVTWTLLETQFHWHKDIRLVGSRDISVGIVDRLWAGRLGSFPGRDKMYFFCSPFHNFQTGFGAHPVSYPKGNESLFLVA